MSDGGRDPSIERRRNPWVELDSVHDAISSVAIAMGELAVALTESERSTRRLIVLWLTALTIGAGVLSVAELVLIVQHLQYR